MNPVISIGLPCYNVEKYVTYAIHSILNQTFKDWELIIIDDNSTDGTYEILKSFEYDDRITILKDFQNRGLSFRLNQIANLSRGKYLIRMDADDIMDIERIESQLKFLLDNPQIDVLGTYAYAINHKNNITGLRKCNKTTSIQGAVRKSIFIHPTIIGSVKWFRENPYNEECIRMEDHELWVRTFTKSKFEVLDIPLLFYREVGTPHLQKYWLSKLNAFRIVKGKKEIAISTKLLFVIIEILKGIFFSLTNFLGLTDFFVKRRGKEIGVTVRTEGEERLKKAITLSDKKNSI